MKLTAWYPGTVKPVRRGMYERAYPNDGMVARCHWNGYVWQTIWPRTGELLNSIYQRLPWRGLTEKAR